MKHLKKFNEQVILDKDEQELYNNTLNVPDSTLLSWAGYQSKKDFEDSADMEYSRKAIIQLNYEDILELSKTLGLNEEIKIPAWAKKERQFDEENAYNKVVKQVAKLKLDRNDEDYLVDVICDNLALKTNNWYRGIDGERLNSIINKEIEEFQQNESLEPGQWVTLKEPYLGYRRAQLVEYRPYKWTVELPSGKQIEVYEDEFEEE